MVVFEGKEEDLGTLDHCSKQSFITLSPSCLDDGSVENGRNHGSVASEVSEGLVVLATSLKAIHVIFWQSECPKNLLETKLKGSELISLVARFFF